MKRKGFEIALVVYDDHHEFRNVPFPEWTRMGMALVACGVVIEENEKWLKIVGDYNFEHSDIQNIVPKNLVPIILKKAITYERRFRVRDCPPVDGLLTAFRNMKQEEEMP